MCSHTVLGWAFGDKCFSYVMMIQGRNVPSRKTNPTISHLCKTLFLYFISAEMIHSIDCTWGLRWISCFYLPLCCDSSRGEMTYYSLDTQWQQHWAWRPSQIEDKPFLMNTLTTHGGKGNTGSQSSHGPRPIAPTPRSIPRQITSRQPVPHPLPLKICFTVEDRVR